MKKFFFFINVLAAVFVGGVEPESLPEISYPQGEITDWYGFRQYNFEFEGHKAFIVVPQKAAPGRPWSWCLQWPTAFVPNTPAIKLVEAGYHHVHIDLHATRMNPEGIRIAGKFYALLQSLQLNRKGALIGLSYGGLYSLRWAEEHPETVSCIYLDAPLCSFNLKGDEAVLEKAYNCEGDFAKLTKLYAPVNHCEKIAKAGIPILLVRHGQDQVVDTETNSDLLTKNFRAAGGKITVINRAFCKHHPHGLENPAELVDFILKNQK